MLGLEDTELIDLWNRYCYSIDNPDDIIRSMNDFNEDYSSLSPLEVAGVIEGTDFDSTDDYYYFRRSIYLESGDAKAAIDTMVSVDDSFISFVKQEGYDVYI